MRINLKITLGTCMAAYTESVDFNLRTIAREQRKLRNTLELLVCRVRYIMGYPTMRELAELPMLGH